jgi:hypothetical protein
MAPSNTPVAKAAVLGGCFALALLLLGGEVLPFSAVHVDDLGSDYGLLTWDLWAQTEAARDGRSLYHTDLLFHPIGADLATHTYGPGFLPVGLATRTLLGGDPRYPLYAHRICILLCFALGTWLAQQAFRTVGADGLPAFAAAVGWAFAACWAPVVANQTLASACVLVPAVTLALAALVRRPSPRRAAAAAAAIAGSVYFSEYYSAFIAVAVLVAGLAAAAWTDTRRALLRLVASLRARGVALAVLTALLVASPFLAAWSRTEGRPPGQRQIYAGGANLASFVCPDPSITPAYASPLVTRLHERITRGAGPFLGLPTLAFAALGLRRCERRLRRVLCVLALAFLALSLGPTLRIFDARFALPMPYAVLMKVPPFGTARAPERLAALGIWPLLCFASLGLTASAAALRRRRGRLAGAAAALLALAWWAVEGHRPAAPAVSFTPSSALEHLPPGNVANLPLSIMDGGAMFLQVFHARPILTGYVSRVSTPQYEHVRRLQELLDGNPDSFVAEARRLGVGTVILEPGTPPEAAAALARSRLNVIDLRDGLLGASVPQR